MHELFAKYEGLLLFDLLLWCCLKCSMVKVVNFNFYSCAKYQGREERSIRLFTKLVTLSIMLSYSFLHSSPYLSTNDDFITALFEDMNNASEQVYINVNHRVDIEKTKMVSKTMFCTVWTLYLEKVRVVVFFWGGGACSPFHVLIGLDWIDPYFFPNIHRWWK